MAFLARLVCRRLALMELDQGSNPQMEVLWSSVLEQA
jgi:hypothetical protein